MRVSGMRRVKWFVRDVGQRVAPRLLLSVMARRSWLHEPEIKLLPMLAPRGLTAVDAGANKGVYLHHLSRNFDHVVAFEPLPALASYLQRAAPRNARVHAVALSDHEGEAELSLPVGFNELGSIEPGHASSGAASQPACELEVHHVRKAPLDSFGLKQVGLLKIDVEGHELAVLEGARRLIADWRPVVMVEVEERHRAGGVAAVHRFFAEQGYQGFFLDADRLRSMQEFDPARDQNTQALSRSVKVGRYINNFIFIHASSSAERVAEINRRLKSRASASPASGRIGEAFALARRLRGGSRAAMPRPQG